MALMDDRTFLVSHVRNSFITGDDTSMSELILDVDESNGERHSRLSTSESKRPNTWHIGRGDTSDTDSCCELDTELPNSYDIVPDMDFASHRRRSNTAQRLEILQREKVRQSKIKHVVWKEITTPPDPSLFEKKPVKVHDTDNKISLLTKLLAEAGDGGTNHFSDYAKYNGKMAPAGTGTKTIEIYFTMTTDNLRLMNVCIISSATVQNLVGLACYLYSQSHKQPPLKDSIDRYSLHIVDDDGEVETDFPALDNKEPISKFGFNKLALVEKSHVVLEEESICVTINMPGRGASRLSVGPKQTLREILEKVIERRRLKTVKGLDYRFEKQDDPGVAINLDSQVCNLDTTDLCLVRDNSVRGDIIQDGETSSLYLNPDSYRSYQVHMVNKLSKNTPYQLGVSGEKIEIDPVGSAGFFRSSSKAVSHEIRNIKACYHTDNKSSRTIFRLECVSSQEKQIDYNFECEPETAEDIISQVNHILDIRGFGQNLDSAMRERAKKLKKRNTLPALFSTF